MPPTLSAEEVIGEWTLAEFKIDGEEITDTMLQDATYLMQWRTTLNVLKKILLVKNEQVLNYLTDHKDIQRTWKPFMKNVRQGGQPVDIDLGKMKSNGQITNFQKAMAVTLVLFEERDKSMGTCSTCADSAHQGPLAYCFVPKNMKYSKGACTNCYFTGKGKKCKHRLDREKEELIKDLDEWIGLKDEELEELTLEELDHAIEVINEELEEKRAAKEQRVREARSTSVHTKGPAKPVTPVGRPTRARKRAAPQ